MIALGLSVTSIGISPTTCAQTPVFYRVRIFTRQREVPFAGHPTLLSCHVWLAAGGVAKGREIVQECGLGLIHIRRSPERLHDLQHLVPAYFATFQ